jgi:hypothetical protein
MLTLKKMFEMQNELMRLKEDHLQIEGKLRIMTIENEGLKRSISLTNSANTAPIGY